MKTILLISALLVIGGCALSPEQQELRARTREREAQQLAVALASRCDTETARLMALRYQEWQGGTDADKAAYAAHFADARFQACFRMAQENYQLEQELRDLEELEWRREMRRERNEMMRRPPWAWPRW